ncbi:RNA polymerase Rpb7, N-terminal [Penicillium expansum]|uniref:DNA-directed RNA polymerase subunit n=1 Tax=Penicillium expansum TaxID=27334 RepID=A0A0A2JNP3_PENEN|nr:RNA polymerase Rpb7, N-terminal [Penicillium expansum]KGO43098.1 RNA polymerase Rpb7, N-terminal [Penicillium expansum]KGO53859.1 RNA polymerase Rpb7, N-terminal [Penicillium expansum]KGO56461.1 RNA polymerase Rpb7, N-terminal [Penicillium expansum]
MAIDAMEIDNLPLRTADAERKRKSKKDASAASPSKKRKQSSSSKATPHQLQDSPPESPFTLTTATLYLPLSPISISPTHALASLLAEHLSPLLLTYFPPLKGVVLAYSNASISSKPPAHPRASSDLNPQPLTLATTADEYGVLYVYLTATFLVFRPKRGQTLDGWVNVQSEGFLGAVVFNLFSVGVERKRLPSNWKWVPPGEEAETPALTDDDSGSDKDMADFDAEKECFKPATLSAEEIAIDGEEEDESAHTGYFQSVSGHRVNGSVRFRVVDVDVIPGSERDRGFLSIEGTMLSVEEEERLLESERQGQSLPPSFFSSPQKVSGSIPVMNVPAASAVQELSTVDVHLEASPKKEKKEKKEKKTEKTEKKEKKSKSSKSKSKDE